MWKTVLAGSTALVIACSSLAVAQAAPANDASRDRPTATDIAARVDVRLARIKARLRLTSEQQKYWPAVESAVRDIVKERATQRSDRRASRSAEANAPRPDLIDRIRLRADAMAARAADFKRVADAAEPLYKNLDGHQKRELAAMLRRSRERATRRSRDDGSRFSERRSWRDGQRFSHRGYHEQHGSPGRDER
jgi:zinc resistance-associated protein